MSTEHLFPSVPGTYTPTPRAKKKTPSRGFQVKQSTVPTLLTDHQVLEARWLFEFGGWSTHRVMGHYGLSKGYVRSLLCYQTRSKLYPKREDFPVGHSPV